MIITPAALQALMVGFRAEFQAGQTLAASQYLQIATEVPGTGKSTTYGWLGKFPALRQWVGDRVINDMAAASYTITNIPFESTVGVDRDDIEDDNIGVYKPLMQEMGRAATVFPDELVFPLLDAGISTECYDGQYFFDTDHPVYPNADGTGAAVSVANYDDNSASSNPMWFLLDTTRAIKPFIYQNRRSMQFQQMTKMDDEQVFMAKQFRYGMDCRANAGYGMWQMAYASRKDLTADNIWAAYGAMRAFKADGGKPLGIKPNLLVVRGTHEQAAREALKATISGGETNTLSGLLTVLVADFL
ncbi:Mu-like prophage major head subunit gpT family protein [Shewanella yunxiaonensis]|uniref:Mu-like prophage major head subunit gpT family protein n=1 Tax=Shewanella yunxiaonensis TaxID=2829809 RepID=A0ABX7YUI0_9GAMM|nr:Mu-like prophage major head subunit gpT family protein [Shewanella yunxiaonensis]QUN06435.1 Mu-like prophage major head subunit gpT family protein [Shewanella yunxiaonensis]